MTTLDLEPLDEELAAALSDIVEPSTTTSAPEPPAVAVDDDGPVVFDMAKMIRPLLASTLSTTAAAMMVGGIFGSWPARLLALVATLFGAGWCYLTLRVRKRFLLQLGSLPAAFAVGSLALLIAGEPGGIGQQMGDAIAAGRGFRPPVPFDAGWRPIIVVVLAMLAFGAGWLGTAVGRPQLGFALPLPLVFLTAISQPKDAELIAGVLAFVPLVVALAVLFGGDSGSAAGVSSAFELRRALRSLPLVILGVVLLLVLNTTSFLFPQPRYDPAEKAQKPKSIPLGAARDRVLFEVQGELTGPWKFGVLDVYDGTSWLLPEFDPDRLETAEDLYPTGIKRDGDVVVKITPRDVGSGATLPGVVDPTTGDVTALDGVVWDPRIGVFRMKEGRVPANSSYVLTLAKYPTADEYRSADRAPDVDPYLVEVPAPPPSVQALLATAPENRWDRLDYLRQKLNEVVIAVGSGSPSVDVPPATVENLLAGDHKGSPFEIVAAEALLARWAGVPSRIGFGFDGFNDEDGIHTVRPKNGANWLEVSFDGLGWTPLVGKPPRAQASLDNETIDKDVLPSDEIAVDIYVPVRLKNLQQLYERLRALLLSVLPVAVSLLATWLSLPAIQRAHRRRKRVAWAGARGPKERILIEYAAFREQATDLSVGDTYDTALEYLRRVHPDPEHTELAWLITRVMYGDLSEHVDERDVEIARSLSRSLRKRMVRVQPFQTRLLGILSRASLADPFTLDIPSVRLIKLRLSSVAGPLRGLVRQFGRRVGRLPLPARVFPARLLSKVS